MPNCGFKIRFQGKKAKSERCYTVTFDYDEWCYSINSKPKKTIPKTTKKITIEVE